VDQDQLIPYVAYEGYVVRVPHNPLSVEIVYETRSAETINLLGALPMKLNG
jgi:hypothetical protein